MKVYGSRYRESSATPKGIAESHVADPRSETPRGLELGRRIRSNRIFTPRPATICTHGMVAGSVNEPPARRANPRRATVENLIRSSNLINQQRIMKLGSLPTYRQLVIKVAFKLTMAAAKSGPREANIELFAGFSAPSSRSGHLPACCYDAAGSELSAF